MINISLLILILFVGTFQKRQETEQKDANKKEGTKSISN